jgi:hypothetical protein
LIIADLRSFFPVETDVELPENIQADIKAAEEAPDQEPDCLSCPNRDSEDSLACCKLYNRRARA